MTDFATQVRHQSTDFIIRSLLDIDFYKLTMGYFIHTLYKGIDVKFKLINRDAAIPLADIIPESELRAQLDHVKTLMLRRTDLYYLRGMDVYGKNMFSEDYLAFLRGLTMTDYNLRRVGSQYELTFQGPWEQVTFWETIALAIISELYYRNLMKGMSKNELNIMYGRATDKIYKKFKKIAEHSNALITNFGLRRRHSFLWEKHVTEMAQEVLGDQFAGTSNVWMAFNNDLIPIGTNAHELPMVATAIAEGDEAKRSAQYDILWQWGQVYGEGLRICLSDTYGTDQFYNHMPADLAESVAYTWKGQRQDSGDPAQEALFYMSWLREQGLEDDAIAKKFNIFSDGLDVDDIIRLSNQFKGELITPMGWGTKMTNDFTGCLINENPLFRPFSMVVKVYEANGNPAVKLSNNVNKATGDPEAVREYIRIFGEKGRGSQKVIV